MALHSGPPWPSSAVIGRHSAGKEPSPGVPFAQTPELRMLAELLPQIATPVTIINGGLAVASRAWESDQFDGENQAVSGQIAPILRLGSE
jgi:hypothetical protein